MRREMLPWPVKQQCLWIVRGYEKSRLEYKRLRLEILDSSGSHDGTFQASGGEAGRPTEQRQMRLESLDRTLLAKQIHAVERASSRIGDNLPVSMRDQLREAILLNCQNGRSYPFERLYIVGISRTDFYRYRDRFLASIAEELGLMVRK